MSNRLEALNPTRRAMVAASLEIDGRPDVAAAAVIPGHVSEFTYAGSLDRPLSAKAVELEELKAELEAEIARIGIDALVANLRAPKAAIPADVAAVEILPEFTRRMIAASLEIDGHVDDEANPALAVSLALNGTDRLDTFKSGPNERMVAATPVQEQAARTVLAGLEAMIAVDGLEATIAALRADRRPAAVEAITEADDLEATIAKLSPALTPEQVAAGMARLMADAAHDAATEKVVAEFAEILTAEKALVFTTSNFDGRPGFRSLPCDGCFGRGRRDWPFVGPILVRCYRCDGAGFVFMNQAMIDAKLTPVADEPTQDPADLEDTDPTADRARVWDEAAAAYRGVFLLGQSPALSNPYAAPDAESCGHEIAGPTLEGPAEYCETPADECDRHDS